MGDASGPFRRAGGCAIWLLDQGQIYRICNALLVVTALKLL